jgi:hypothetical protein
MLALISLVVYFISIIYDVQLIVCRYLFLGWRTEAYLTLCKLWASEEFIAKFIKAWESTGSGGSGHTYGPDGHVHMSKQMVRKIIMKMHS